MINTFLKPVKTKVQEYNNILYTGMYIIYILGINNIHCDDITNMAMRSQSSQ